MQWEEVAQAVTMSRQGPFALCLMAMLPAAMFEIMVGMKSGEIQRPEGSSIILAVSRYWTSKPPIPEPTYTPRRNGSMFCSSPSVCRPESFMACQAAAMPYCVKRSCLRMNGLSMPNSSALKFLILPAILTGRSSVGKLSINSMPHTPSLRFFQKVSTSFPTEEMTPIPVMTTRLFII